jgi:hypothetical protein
MENTCIFSNISFFISKNQGLKGVNRYAQAFLEELEVHKLKSTDKCIQTLKDYAIERKLVYRLIIEAKDGKELEVIYDPK